jgi:ribosomal 50S subunit-associated protein YjgA (DUF615 family)
MPEDICVIVERIDNLKEHLTERLDRIETQTTKTNGRVGSLEAWRNRIIGGFLVITTIFVPVAIKVFSSWFE